MNSEEEKQIKSIVIDESKKEAANLDHIHERLRHRLQTARFTVWGGGIAIVFLTIVSIAVAFLPKEPLSIYEILRTSIATRLQ